MVARRRILSDATAKAALEAAGEARRCAVQVLTEAPIHGAAYQAAGQVLVAADSLAEALTGNRQLFHLPSVKAGG